MAYPRDLLTDGETVEYELRQHWRTLIPAVVVAVLTVPAASYLAAKTDVSALRWIILVVALIVLVRWSIKPVVEWATTEYVITDRRIIMRSGVIARSGRDMPMSKVNDVQFRCSATDRIFRCGSIIIESAGESSGLRMDNVGDVERIQREIARLHDEDAMRRRRESE